MELQCQLSKVSKQKMSRSASGSSMSMSRTSTSEYFKRSGTANVPIEPRPLMNPPTIESRYIWNCYRKDEKIFWRTKIAKSVWVNKVFKSKLHTFLLNFFSFIVGSPPSSGASYGSNHSEMMRRALESSHLGDELLSGFQIGSAMSAEASAGSSVNGSATKEWKVFKFGWFLMFKEYIFYWYLNLNLPIFVST